MEPTIAPSDLRDLSAQAAPITRSRRRFLHEPHPMLEGRPPVRVALIEQGARRAEDLLSRLFYGLPA